MARPPPDFPLPQVHAELEPFIAPRTTVLEKRRVLDVLVQEICAELDNPRTIPTRPEFEAVLDEKLGRVRVKGGKAKGKFGWKAGDEKEELVMECPRREYLRAYRDRVEARRAWEKVCEDEEESDEEELDDEETVEREEKSFAGLFAHYQALNTTTQSLIVLRDYLAEFTAMLEEKPPSIPTDIKLNFPAPPAAVDPSPQPNQSSGSRNASLLLPLQSQIFEVARDISALRKFPQIPLIPGAGDKAKALFETRLELIAWIEENLPSNFDGAPKNPENNDAPSAEAREESEKKLEEAYDIYCNEREILCAAQKKLGAVPTIPNLKGITFSDSFGEDDRTPGTPTRRRQSMVQIQTESIYPHLHALTQMLPQLIARHKALVQDKSALEVSLAANSNTIKEIIGKHHPPQNSEESYIHTAKGWMDELAVARAKLQSEVRAQLKAGENYIAEGVAATEKVGELVGDGEGGWELIDGGVGVIGGGI